MALPSISTPEFKTTIPSTGETIRYRPFLVKEEKILLMTLEGTDQEETTRAILKILDACIIDDIDVNTLATFDIEFLFLKLRGKSVGEVVELTIGHSGETECEHRTKVTINLDDIKVVGEVSDGKVMVTDNVGVKLKYPTIALTQIKNLDSTEGMFKLITSSIEYIFDDTEVYSEFKESELVDWLEQLNQSQFQKITTFFQEMPKLQHKIEWTCEKCGEKDAMVVEGLQNFFT